MLWIEDSSNQNYITKMNTFNWDLKIHIMKKSLIFLSCAIFCLTSIAQSSADTSKHLSFKGVPIDGTLTEYVSKMKKSGFTHEGTNDGVAILSGEFASYKDCYIGVSTLKKIDLVNKIVVIFQDRDNWSSLSSNYYDLKDLLTIKYGKPSREVEEFQGYTPRDDSGKFTAVRLDRCKYITVFETEKGEIRLTIANDGVARCYVTLSYIDKINSEEVKKQALDDL